MRKSNGSLPGSKLSEGNLSFFRGFSENVNREEIQDEDLSFEDESWRESPLQWAISAGWPPCHQMDPIHPRLPGAHGDSKYIRLWWQIILDFCPCFQFMPCSCVPACSCARVTRWFLCRQLSQFLGKCAPDHPDETALLLFHQSLFLINFAKLNSCDTDWRLCSYWTISSGQILIKRVILKAQLDDFTFTKSWGTPQV